MIKTIKPKKLNKGDTIGVVSPSDPLEDINDKQFQSGIRYLENLGFKLILGKNICSKNPKERAEDINTFFADKEVKAIISTQGGDTCEKLLPFIDFEVIQANPKIFIGISDITILLNAINKKTGLITFHGNDVKWGFGRSPTEYEKKEFLRILMENSKGKVPANKERKTIRGGKAEGRLMGGNLYCLLKLAGTEYWPNLKDSILLLEEYDTKEEDCINQLNRLKELDVFEQIKGVVVGYIYGLQKLKPNSKQMEDILSSLTKEFKFPILKINDFGHNTPNTIIPIGALAEIDADKKEIKILENVVL